MTTQTDKYQHPLYWKILRKQGILREVLLDWLQVLELKIRIYRERQQLRSLSDLMLDDIGVTPAEAEIEARSIKIPQARLDRPRNAA